jgi:hypothetical protein
VKLTNAMARTMQVGTDGRFSAHACMLCSVRPRARPTSGFHAYSCFALLAIDGVSESQRTAGHLASLDFCSSGGRLCESELGVPVPASSPLGLEHGRRAHAPDAPIPWWPTCIGCILFIGLENAIDHDLLHRI